MDRYSDLDLHVWVADSVLAEGSRKVEALLALLGEVKFRSPLQPTVAVTALVGPDWQRVGWLRARWLRLRCDACGRALCAQP